MIEFYSRKRKLKYKSMYFFFSFFDRILNNNRENLLDICSGNLLIGFVSLLSLLPYFLICTAMHLIDVFFLQS